MKKEKAKEQKSEKTEASVKIEAQKSSPIGEALKPEQNKVRLQQCEDIIRQNENGPFITGRNLALINSEGLYKAAGFNTFESYCKQRWGMSDKHAYRLMDAAKCYDLLAEHQGEDNWTLPRNEAQVRPLTRLEDKEVVSSWKKVMKKFYGQAFTAEDIENLLFPEPAAPTKADTDGDDDDDDEPAEKPLEQKLKRIDKLVQEALEKVEDQEEVPVKTYRRLLNQIKALIEDK